MLACKQRFANVTCTYFDTRTWSARGSTDARRVPWCYCGDDVIGWIIRRGGCRQINIHTHTRDDHVAQELPACEDWSLEAGFN